LTIRWQKRAFADLDAIFDQILAENPKAARQVWRRIIDRIDQLAEHPESGRPGRVAGTRELVVTGTPYIVFYRVADQVVHILRIYHGARRPPQKL